MLGGRGGGRDLYCSRNEAKLLLTPEPAPGGGGGTLREEGAGPAVGGGGGATTAGVLMGKGIGAA